MRELLTTPRSPRHFGIRCGYVAALCVLIYTGAQATFGLTPLRSLGDVALFGSQIFRLVCFVQLTVVLAAALILSSGAIAQEKDRRTLILLLMTDLHASELVIGKSLASILPVLTLIAVSIPVLCCVSMLGGVEVKQILWAELLCLASALAATSWGTLVGYWREKTFQILSLTLLGAGLFLGIAEAARALAASALVQRIAGWCNPFRTLWEVLHPLTTQPLAAVPEAQALGGVGLLIGLCIVCWGVTCWRVRVWNPSRFVFVQIEESASPETAGHIEEAPVEDTSTPDVARAPREIWNWPILWREICTQAYGRRVGWIKAAYFAVAAFSIIWLSRMPADAPLMFGAVSNLGLVFTLLSILTLVLVNAQSVTSLTSERDGQTLELLLVTEVTSWEFIFGKLGGVFFNTKEVIILPLLLAIMGYLRGEIGLESLLFIILGDVILVLFAALVGLHAGLSYDASRAAILNSLGTIFFLFVGVFVCMMLIVEARTSFILQLIPFLLFILGGSLGLWASLTHKNPAPALALCAWALPFLTFYAVVSFLLRDTAAACAAIVAGYGFTSLAILIPAVSAFDVALGRTSLDRS